ncbi:hypothetical protein [Lacrimispora sp.]|jgi:hypothetical protein|uniref:hypothetical protein n=1 Tax=Lacrimispora sp. TaxID=2719234 RepID=UPI0028AD3979|nr:hypothetical protein [Lacrimispora sp.]
MENKDLYNKLMLLVFGLIVILLCAGSYNYFNGSKSAPEIHSPVKDAKVLVLEEIMERDLL